MELIREQPSLAAVLLDCVRSELTPDFSRAQLESGDLSENKPAAYYADAVVTLGDEDPALAVIIEVQLRPDRRKHLSWPAYLATARARLDCPAVLLAICPDAAVARWARQPIRLGHPGLVLTPLVLGPEQVPVLTGEACALPELAVVSAAVHGAGSDGPKIFATMLESLGKIEPEQAQGYIDEVLAVLPEAARSILEAMVKTRDREYKSDFARGYYREGKAEGKAEGEVKGEARMLFALLAARGVTVPEDARARIDECTDPEQLVAWGLRAATAEVIEDVFG
ncbi:MAG: hypothetical protein ACRDP6_02910 [Actinoallomurus sp.]